MYTAKVRIKGTAPLLQHRFGPAVQAQMMKGSRKNTGSVDYGLEWIGGMYVTSDGYLYQPGTHLEASLVRAAASFKIKGQRTKTWKDPVKAYVYVQPDCILHRRNGEPVLAPGPELTEAPTEYLSVSVMRAVVQRAAVARSRLMIAPGWELDFTIDVADDQVRPEVLEEVTREAGRAIGISDFRPRYGRFEVSSFELV